MGNVGVNNFEEERYEYFWENHGDDAGAANGHGAGPRARDATPPLREPSGAPFGLPQVLLGLSILVLFLLLTGMAFWGTPVFSDPFEVTVPAPRPRSRRKG